MLCWSGEIRVGAGSLRHAIGLHPSVRLYASIRRGMITDTELDIPYRGPVNDQLTLYALLSGDLWLRDPTVHVRGPALILLPQPIVDGANGKRTRTYTNYGEPLTLCEVTLAAKHWRGPAHSGDPREVLVLEHDDALVSALNQASLDFLANDPQLSRAGAHAILDAVISRGLVDPELRGAPTLIKSSVERLWMAFAPVLRSPVLPSLDELAERMHVSARQVQRTLARLTTAVGLPPELHFRDLTLMWRLRLAVRLLSIEDAPSSLIARRLGYSDSNALARALTHAGLGGLAELREQLLARHRQLREAAAIIADVPSPAPSTPIP